jgi:predicted metal-binding membrane protein
VFRVRLIALGRTVRQGPWPALLLASLLGWAGLLLSGQPPVMTALCSGRFADVFGAGAAALRINGLASLAGWWLLMLLAMTPPLLAQPLRRLWRGSLARKRASVIAAFIVGYGAVWSVSGVAFLAAAGWLGSTGTRGLLAALGLMSIWALSPARRVCLGRAHRAPRLRVFGLAADVDGLAYGVTSAAWCVGSCWPLMLAPLLAREAHVPVMALAAGLMAFQRLVPASDVRWNPSLRPAKAG